MDAIVQTFESTSLPVKILSLAVAAAVVALLNQSRNRKLLPPGPKGLPIIGNVLDMPKQLEWETFGKWGKEHDSGIVYAEALGNSIIILNSYKMAQDLLDKRSGIYSSRPHVVMFHELSGYGYNFAMLPYGDVWRACRRLFNRHLAPSNPAAYHGREIKHTRDLLFKLAKEPKKFRSHIKHLVGANALDMIYGLPIKPSEDPYLKAAATVAEVGMELITPRAFFVDVFPFLKHIPTWFPGAYFHKAAKRMRDVVPLIREYPFAAAEKLKKTGRYQPSLVMNGLDELETDPDSALSLPEKSGLDLLKDVAAQGFVGAADTTTSAIGSFFLAMVMYPEVQKKAQAELDQVLQGRLPVHKDIEKLPYLTCLLREVYRWHPVLPLGVPHVVTGDDTYNGYHIPAGATVIPNQWAMCYDETVYPESHLFKPERYLKKDGTINPSILDPAEIVFGFGRRACAGRHLAHSLLTLTCASVLAMFDLEKAIDGYGDEITPGEEYHNGPICYPLDFPCVIKPRSKDSEDLIVAWESGNKA